VYISDGTTLAILFGNRDRSVNLPNPLYTDSIGNLAFWTNPGNYIGEIDGSHQFSIQVPEDPDEAVTGSTSAELVIVQRMVAQDTSGHRLMVPDDDGKAIYADSSDPTHISRPVWMTTNAWSNGIQADLLALGQVVEPTWDWTPNQPIWIGSDGFLTQDYPVGAAFLRRVAEAVTPITIYFSPQQSIAII
jgi:hypothetical protein